MPTANMTCPYFVFGLSNPRPVGRLESFWVIDPPGGSELLLRHFVLSYHDRDLN